MISNSFVEKIFNDITERIAKNQEIFLRQVSQMEEKVEAVMNIKVVDMPVIEEKFLMNSRRTILLGKQFVNKKADDSLAKIKRDTFKALHAHMKGEQRVTKVLNRMIRNFRKVHFYQEMRRFKH